MKTKLKFNICNQSDILCKIYRTEWYMKRVDLMGHRRWLLVFEGTVMFCLIETTNNVHYKSNYPLFWI